MASLFTPTSRAPGTLMNLKLTPSNSPVFLSGRPGAKSPARQRNYPTPAANGSSGFADCGLSLRRVIGCSTAAFDSHVPSRSFGYTAGAAAVVVTLDDDLQVTQRFFRARPNAQTLTSAASSLSFPSTPQHQVQETRNRAAASLREAGIGYSLSPGNAAFSGDSPGSGTWTARERIKAATCLSFSPDGKWLAVGETGYNPRVLIFSMLKDVPSDVPVAAMSEHTFGVKDVAFSPCSRYLASIGTMNDGFIYVWALNTNRPGLIRLHSSNKCTSFVRQITWMGNSIVTVGTRHVKVWKTEDEQKPVSPGPRVLHGRNALLGAMSDSAMSCVVAISENKSLICSERGDICLLEEVGMRFSKVANADFGVNCISIDAESKFAWVAGRDGNIRALVLKEIVPSTPPSSTSSSRSNSPVLPYGCRPANVMAMASMLGHLFTLDSNRSLKIINMTIVESVPMPTSLLRELPAHKDACLGVRLLPPKHASGADFFTWSMGGVVLFWTLGGVCKRDFQVELEQPTKTEDDIPNELRVVCSSENGDYFVTGDRFGVLRIIDGQTSECHFDAKAHSGEIMDISVQNDTIASCARDRTVQVFTRSEDSWNLCQTLDDHTASVSCVLLAENGEKLISSSSDRTIVIRDLCRREDTDSNFPIAYIPMRTLTTKASPIHMTLIPDNVSTLLVSTMDRQIIRFDLNTGRQLHSFRTTDDSGDAVAMDAINVTKEREGRPRILAGTSTTDKSIRLYEVGGGLIDKEWGHTEGVSDVALLETEDDAAVISTGTDGTIMIWDFRSPGATARHDDNAGIGDDDTPSKELTASRTPLRRVLSRSELLDFAPKPSPAPDPSKSRSLSAGSSPPRPLRKKRSGYGINAMSRIVSGKPSDDCASPLTPMSFAGSRDGRKGVRDRTPSPPDAPSRLLPPPRRNSYDSRARGKSDSSISGAGNINGTAESLTRSLRSFRKKIEATGVGDCGVRPDVLREFQRELGLSIKELSVGENTDSKDRKSPDIDRLVDDGGAVSLLLDQYSQRLLDMFNDRLGIIAAGEKVTPRRSKVPEKDVSEIIEEPMEMAGEG